MPHICFVTRETSRPCGYGGTRERDRIPTHASPHQDLGKVVAALEARARLEGAVLCSVVPRRTGAWKQVLKRQVAGPVIEVNHRTALGIKVTYPEPSSIGPDRLANACGAVHRYGAPVIVADFGTALTIPDK